MWRDLEEEAIIIGLDLHYFWSLNPKQFEKYIKIYEKKEKNRIIEKDMFNHMLGKYISFAFNDPKHYPDKNFLSIEEKIEMTDDEMEKMARKNTIAMGGAINDN